MSRLVLHLFGSPLIQVNGTPLEVDTRKATALLAYLAVSGETHQRDTLAVLLWPDYDQSSARAALRRTLSTLNRALETEKGNEFMEIARESVGLIPGAAVESDVNEFRQRIAALSRHGHSAGEVCPTCLNTLEEAAALYREPFMAGFNLRDSPNFEEWQFFQEETLRRELSSALEKLIFGLTAAERVEDAIQYARRWLALDPLLEEAHRQLMLLYTRADQRNAALRQYRECVRILDQELGVAPLEETTALYESILNRAPLPELAGRLRFVQDTPSTVTAPPAVPAPAPEPQPQPGETSGPPRPWVGRNAELSQLRESYAAIHADGRLVALEGEAGIGKTRLADTFLDETRANGARVMQARCYAGESGLAYAPFIQGLGAALHLPDAAARLKGVPPGMLAEVSRLLPELTTFVPSAMVTPGSLPVSAVDGAQARFFEALRQVICALLTGPRPGVIFLDDLHWADAASLDLLTYLARRLKDVNLLILVAWRDETNQTVQTLDRLVGELARGEQAARLPLKRLDQAALIEWVRAYPGVTWSQPKALGERLFQESEGLPFVAAEYMAVLASQGAEAEPASGEWDMPAGVRDLLRSRLAGLDAAAQQLLSTAAVIGRSFDFNTLREVSGRSELEAVDGLDQLLASGLVTEQGGQERGRTDSLRTEIHYDFTHEKLRALIYEETSLARRRLLHRRTAETLSHVQSGRFETPGVVAFHYEAAGLAAQAAEYHLLAGEQARRLYANVEALAHFQAALAAGHPDAVGLHEAIGDLHTLRGEYPLSLASYQTAAALCSPGCLANLEHKLGNVHQRLGEWDLAESHYLISLEAAGDPDEAAGSAFHVHLFADRSLTAHAQGRLEDAQALAARALALAQKIDDPYALAQAYNVVGVMARAGGRQTEAINALQASLDAAQALEDPLARIAALNNLALVYGEGGNTQEAIRLARQALELCQKRGDRHREAALHNNLADLLHREGREDEAMDQLKQAVVIFAEIGSLPESASPVEAGRAEIWKLTEW